MVDLLISMLDYLVPQYIGSIGSQSIVLLWLGALGGILLYCIIKFIKGVFKK